MATRRVYPACARAARALSQRKLQIVEPLRVPALELRVPVARPLLRSFASQDTSKGVHGGAGGATPAAPGGGPSVAQTPDSVSTEALDFALVTRMQQACAGKDAGTVMDLFMKLKRRGSVNLLSSDLLGRMAMTLIPAIGAAQRMSAAEGRQRLKVVKELYDAVEEARDVSSDMIMSLSRAYALARNHNGMLETRKLLDAHGFPVTTAFLQHWLIACTQSPVHLDVADRMFDDMEKAQERITPAAYNRLIRALVHAEKGRRATYVMQHMISSGIEPSATLVYDVIRGNIRTADADALRHTTGWMLALGVDMDQGTCERLLDCAAIRGDHQLANRVWNYMKGQGFPTSEANYLCMMHTFAAARDDRSMFTALLTMLQEGHPVTPTTLRMVAATIGSSLNRTDDAYYMVHEFHDMAEAHDPTSEGQAPPPIHITAVNTIILACALQQNLDRAFATFEEITPVFELEPDIHSYNSLLTACAQKRDPQVNAAMNIFQRMVTGQTTVAPNDESILQITLARVRADPERGLDEVMSYLENYGLSVPREALIQAGHDGLFMGSPTAAIRAVSTLRERGESVPYSLGYRLGYFSSLGDDSEA